MRSVERDANIYLSDIYRIAALNKTARKDLPAIDPTLLAYKEEQSVEDFFQPVNALREL